MHPSLVSYAKQHDHHSARKIDARAKVRKRAADEREAIGPEELKRQAREKALEIEAAYDAIEAGAATEEQRELIRKTDDAKCHIQRMRNQQSAIDRIYLEGWTYPGSHVVGLVAGKAHQGPKTVLGLPSEGDPMLKRAIASAGKPKRRNKETAEVPTNALRTGPSPAKCWRQMRPLVAHDEVYWFCSVNCIDLWRHDLDPNKAKGKKWVFESEEHMKAWLYAKHAAGELDFLPQFAVYTPDDRYPGKIPSLHLYYMLPDDGLKAKGGGSSGIWPDQKLQLSMLEQVQSALNDQLGADPGGLANPYHGKHPCSPHNKYVPINRTHLPTIGEMFDTLDVGYGRRAMAGIQGRRRLANIGLDPDSSNSFWIATSEEARSGVRTAYKDDHKVCGTPEHAERAFDRAWEAVREHVKTAGKALLPNAEEVLHNLLEGCIKWALEDFDPDKVNQSGYNPGAAAHLMLPTDDAKTRMRKGQTVGAESKIRHSKRLIAEAMAEIEAEGVEMTISEVSRRSGRCRQTCADHMFPVKVAEIANAMLAIVRSTDQNTPSRPQMLFQGGVWGVSTTGNVKIVPSRPQQIVIDHAHHPDDIPKTWRPPDWNNWKRQKLLDYGRRVSAGRIAVSRIRRRSTGSNVIDFLTAGTVMHYAPRASDKAAT